MKKKYMLITLGLLLVILISSTTYYFYVNYQTDNILESRPEAFIRTDGHGGFSKNEVAYQMVTKASLFVNYISSCKRFPINIEEMYRARDDDPKNCKPFSMRSMNPLMNYGGEIWPWIDPWGRSYQIRYDSKRLKLQVRSLGRYSWLPVDDIKAESRLNIPKTLFAEEQDKFARGNDCAFNRGWH